jgi:hypothetical protein
VEPLWSVLFPLIMNFGIFMTLNVKTTVWIMMPCKSGR